jgi:hypothetical protein
VSERWRVALRERVTRRCGDPRETFAAYGHLFGEWIDRGRSAAVEAGIAGYLGTAARVGRWHGTVAGVLLGAGGGLLAVLVVRVLS